MGLVSQSSPKSFDLALPSLDAYVAVRVKQEQDIVAMTIGCANADVCLRLVHLLREALVKSQQDKFCVENSTPLSPPKTVQ